MRLETAHYLKTEQDPCQTIDLNYSETYFTSNASKLPLIVGVGT